VRQFRGLCLDESPERSWRRDPLPREAARLQPDALATRAGDTVQHPTQQTTQGDGFVSPRRREQTGGDGEALAFACLDLGQELIAQHKDLVSVTQMRDFRPNPYEPMQAFASCYGYRFDVPGTFFLYPAERSYWERLVRQSACLTAFGVTHSPVSF